MIVILVKSILLGSVTRLLSMLTLSISLAHIALGYAQMDRVSYGAQTNESLPLAKA